jgi:hypothetical protein
MPANVANSKKTGATVLSRALEISGGEMPPEGARFVLGLGIRQEDRERMLELLAKQQRGEITAGEREDLGSYIEADNVLSVLRAQALLALKRAGQKN